MWHAISPSPVHHFLSVFHGAIPQTQRAPRAEQQKQGKARKRWSGQAGRGRQRGRERDHARTRSCICTQHGVHMQGAWQHLPRGQSWPYCKPSFLERYMEADKVHTCPFVLQPNGTETDLGLNILCMRREMIIYMWIAIIRSCWQCADTHTT